MRPELETIYERLYDDYPRRNRFGYEEESIFVRTIQKEIDYRSRYMSEVLGNRPVKFRSDAKLFLLVVFFEIIVVPIRISRESPEIPAFQRDIAQDIQAIIASCVARQEGQGEGSEITAHTVLSVVNDIWDGLNISSVKLWNT